MDNQIQVCVVYPDGVVRIYGRMPKDSDVRPFVKALVFPTYGHAVQFAVEFEVKERAELKKYER
jgi:hypothetical protein